MGVVDLYGWCHGYHHSWFLVVDNILKQHLRSLILKHQNWSNIVEAFQFSKCKSTKLPKKGLENPEDNMSFWKWGCKIWRVMRAFWKWGLQKKLTTENMFFFINSLLILMYYLNLIWHQVHCVHQYFEKVEGKRINEAFVYFVACKFLSKIAYWSV